MQIWIRNIEHNMFWLALVAGLRACGKPAGQDPPKNKSKNIDPHLFVLGQKIKVWDEKAKNRLRITAPFEKYESQHEKEDMQHKRGNTHNSNIMM